MVFGMGRCADWNNIALEGEALKLIKNFKVKRVKFEKINVK